MNRCCVLLINYPVDPNSFLKKIH